ncbi:hypothetical protein BHE74_00037148 [Ensete ventricosum]|nr:hypothetical protein BHE74_00037148 [Ensete ventricosum]
MLECFIYVLLLFNWGCYVALLFGVGHLSIVISEVVTRRGQISAAIRTALATQFVRLGLVDSYVPPSLPRSHTKTKLRPDHGAITFNANYGGLDRNHRSSLDSIRPSVLVLQRTVGPMNSKPITVFCTHPHGEMIL